MKVPMRAASLVALLYLAAHDGAGAQANITLSDDTTTGIIEDPDLGSFDGGGRDTASPTVSPTEAPTPIVYVPLLVDDAPNVLEVGGVVAPTKAQVPDPTEAPVVPPTPEPANTTAPVPAPVDPSTEESSTTTQLPLPSSPAPEPEATEAPIPAPTPDPTDEPTSKPTTSSPTSSPSSKPTLPPTLSPTASPSASPTDSPTANTSESPSSKPTKSPTAAPTAAPTTAPTAAPTEEPSSKPSGKPSSEPTDTPTAKPTLSPTDEPTEMPSYWASAFPSADPTILASLMPSSVPTVPPSAAASSSPSASPSGAPTGAPTNDPSAKPSVPPSAHPTESPTGVPSAHPSTSPTAAPSAAPSITPTSQPSVAPTSSPTDQPTDQPSSSPSSSPTPSSRTYTTGVYIRLVGISSTMDGPREAIFEETAKQFVGDSMSETDGVEVIITNAEVSTQSVTNFSPDSDGETNADLLVELEITGEVSPYDPPDTFSFPSTVLSPFVKEFSDFTDALYEKSDFFAPLGHSSSGTNSSPGKGYAQADPRSDTSETALTPTTSEGGGSGAKVMIVVGGAVAGLSVALTMAAVYIKRSRDIANKNALDDISEASGASGASGFTPYGNATSLPSLPLSPRSPNTLEGGKPPSWDFKKDMSPNVQSDAYPQSDAGISNKSFDSKGGDNGDKFKELGLNFSHDSLFQATQEQGLRSPAMTPQSQVDNALSAQNALALTTVELDNRYPMTVGQQYLQEAQAKSSQLISYTDAQSMIGGQFDTRTIISNPSNDSKSTANTRGDNSVQSSMMMVEGTTTPASYSKRELYDCYAPPGPLGIVIDTTPEGPMIHSLKPTSQLLGLLNPGDLVVGLDDIDTRGMTAATLTRLMAKRSQQAQRKITLLTSRIPSS